MFWKKLFGGQTNATKGLLDTTSAQQAEHAFLEGLRGSASADAKLMITLLQHETDFLIECGRIPPKIGK